MQDTSTALVRDVQTSTIPRFVNNCYHEEIRNDYSALVRRVRETIDKTGIAVLENFIHPDFLRELCSTVDQLTPLAYETGKRRPLIGPDLKNTGFYEVTFSEFVIQLANDILAPFNVHLEPRDIHPVLGILIGEQAQHDLKVWHFDATYLTIAMPIVMPPPTKERDGKFRIWPNVRRFSQSLWRERLYWNLAKIGFLRKIVKNFAINFVPGNLYFFYGFRSYHGTDELDPMQLRANCLMNFGGPLFDLQKGKLIKFGQ
jgi:hypothetical protein